MATAIGIVGGGILTILVAIWVEWLRRPRLNVLVEPPIDMVMNPGDLRARTLRVLVSNNALPSLVFFMVRAPALQCRGKITFHRYVDGHEIFSRAMAARWAGSLQPTAIPVVNPNGEVISFIHDPERVGLGSRIDIYPGETEPLDVVARIEGDMHCYGWNNESYFVQPFGRNENWRLGSDRFLVKITIVSSGQKIERVFRLINDVPSDAFRLEIAEGDEISRTTKRR